MKNKYDGIEWAMDCEFSNDKNLKSVQTKGQDCGMTCLADNECTHFNWKSENSENNGTCYLKSGDIRKEDALRISSQSQGQNQKQRSLVCGIMPD